ncbi:MAG: ATP-binding protein, partial [Abditibacteriales bacterium]|nr:ATP-binding protein [Abditibacteriales bacterium]
IEEPGNGIYVGLLKRLFECIDLKGSSGQFIFTSHSPYFIDLFDGCLEGVSVMKGSETHSRLMKPDVEKLRELLGEFSLGELHFRGMIA